MLQIPQSVGSQRHPTQPIFMKVACNRPIYSWLATESIQWFIVDCRLYSLLFLPVDRCDAAGQYSRCKYTFLTCLYRLWCHVDLIFGRLFVKWFAVCYRTIVISVLSALLVYCGQTVGRIKMKHGTEVGLGPGHTVLDRDPSSPPPKKGGTDPHFSADVCCDQPAGWIKMPLGTKVGLSQATLC